MSKEWLIKVCEDDYELGYVGGWESIELGENIKSFLKDHPEGRVWVYLSEILINHVQVIIMNTEELKERIQKGDIHDPDSDYSDS